MPDPRLERIAVVMRELARLDEPRELSARRAYLADRDRLAALVRVGAPGDVVQACRDRVDHAAQLLTVALHPPRSAPAV